MHIIKKYPNRRLYDTVKSAYIKLAEVHDIIKSGEEFKVVDANSGEDITRSILIQIIIEQEGTDKRVFTTDMLTNFVRSYDDATHSLFGEFLEKNLSFFAEQQKNLQKQALGLIENPFPKMMQELTGRNLEMWTSMQQRFFELTRGAGHKSEEK